MYFATCHAGLMYRVTQSLGPIRSDRTPYGFELETL